MPTPTKFVWQDNSTTTLPLPLPSVSASVCLPRLIHPFEEEREGERQKERVHPFKEARQKERAMDETPLPPASTAPAV